MTKAAMTQATKNWAVEWADDHIRVNCVAPWFVGLRDFDWLFSWTHRSLPHYLCRYIDTLLAQQVLQDSAYHAAVIGRTPMGRYVRLGGVVMTVGALGRMQSGC